MGSKLTVLAASLISVVASAQPSGDLKQGIDLYKAGKYPEAAAALTKAYAQDGKPDTLFALAQAERLAGNCTDASIHYHRVLEQVTDFNVAKLVQQNLEICDKLKPPAEPKPDVQAKAEPPPPQVITKTVVREVPRTDTLAATLFAVGTLGLGAAGGLYIAASSNRDAADKARTLDDHNALSDRASSEQKMMFVAAGAGVALMGVAVYRWMSTDETAATGVAVVPSATGGSVWVTGAF